MPDLSDMTEAEAERALELKNLVLGSVIPKDTEVREDDGKIYDQSVRPNAEVAEKTAIDIYVYKYVEPDVPDRTGQRAGRQRQRRRGTKLAQR